MQACRGLVLGCAVLSLMGCDDEEACKADGKALSTGLTCNAADCCTVLIPLRDDLAAFSSKCFAFLAVPEVSTAEVDKNVANLKCQGACIAEAVSLTQTAQCNSSEPQSCCDAVSSATGGKDSHDEKCNFYAGATAYRNQLVKLNDAFDAAVTSCDALPTEALCKDVGANLSSQLECTEEGCCAAYNPIRSTITDFITNCDDYKSLPEVGQVEADATLANTACSSFCVENISALATDTTCEETEPGACCTAKETAVEELAEHETSCASYSQDTAYSSEYAKYEAAFDLVEGKCADLMV